MALAARIGARAVARPLFRRRGRTRRLRAARQRPDAGSAARIRVGRRARERCVRAHRVCPCQPAVVLEQLVVGTHADEPALSGVFAAAAARNGAARLGAPRARLDTGVHRSPGADAGGGGVRPVAAADPGTHLLARRRVLRRCGGVRGMDARASTTRRRRRGRSCRIGTVYDPHAAALRLEVGTRDLDRHDRHVPAVPRRAGRYRTLVRRGGDPAGRAGRVDPFRQRAGRRLALPARRAAVPPPADAGGAVQLLERQPRGSGPGRGTTTGGG